MPRPTKYIAAAAPQLATSPPKLYIGTSGWAYPTWKPGFYPSTVPSRAFLHFYASVLTAVEVNYTFRALPSPALVAQWLGATPTGFRFSFKAPQRITHFQRLRDCEAEVERFFGVLRAVKEAGKLGPALFQLPPNLQADPIRLKSFLAYPCFQAETTPPIAFEFRHPSWFTDETYRVLREAGAALCIADTDSLSTPELRTAPFGCYRLRRDGGYSPAELTQFAHRFRSLASEVPTYVFLRHQDEPTGALNALALLRAANTGAQTEVKPARDTH